MEQMTIREAARELGITPQALRSRAKHRGVILEKAPGPHGERYLVNAAALPLLRDGTVPQDRPVEPSRENVSQANDVIPLSAHLEVIHLLRETQRHLQEAQEQRHKSQEAMRLLERQTMALQWELTNYRRALSENAESLAEQAARARQVEYQVQLAELRADQALAEKSLLAEDNQRQKEEFEREKAAMAEGSRTSVPKIGWLKQKAPRWVRRLLGAG